MSLVKDGGTSETFLKGYFEKPGILKSPVPKLVKEQSNPPTVVSFMSDVTSTSGRLHSESVRLLFLQTHRETDRFFAGSGVQFPEPSSGFFHFHHTVYSDQIKYRVVLVLPKTADLRIMLHIDGAPITSKSYTHRHVDSSTLVFRPSSHRHSELGFIFGSRFIVS